MNILLIVNELRYTCGVTNHILHLSRGFAESGKVNLWIICGGGNGIERFKDINVDIITDKRFFHKGRNLTSYISAITFLAKFLRKNKIDIIHSHTHYAANIAARASRISKVKTVQTNHGILQSKGRLKHFNADKYIAINEHIYDYIIRNNIIGKENISCIRCGIPVDGSPAEKEDGKIKVIAASRFKYEKGLDIFINAVAGLDAETKQKAEFFIAGEGELEHTLKELNIKTNAGIEFLGSLRDMNQLLRKTHIVVYPSRSKSEGFPAIITEAGACNNLILTSNFDGASSVIKNDEGIFFNIDDIKGLTNNLTRAIKLYKEYNDYTLKFYNKVKDWYNIDTMIIKHINLYKELISL
jgi:glycosyltransferase involved in cell wall biosynthesis